MISVVLADYADPAHARLIPELLNAYALDPMGGGVPIPAANLERLVEELSQRAHAFTLLAFVDGEPAGIANCFEGYSTFRAKPLVNIHDLAVLDGFRGAGVGKALMNAVEDEAVKRGCCKVTLEVLEGNKRARAAYQAQGFAAYALDPETGHALFLEKKLGA